MENSKAKPSEPAWRPRHYLDCQEAVAFVSERREHLVNVCAVFEQAARFIQEPEELKSEYQRFSEFLSGLEKAVAEVDRLAAKDDSVLLVADPAGRYALKVELASIATQLKSAKRLRDKLVQGLPAS